MKIQTVLGLTAVLVLAMPALADATSADASVGLSLEAGTSASAEPTPAAGPLDAQITGDNTYLTLTNAINAGDAVDLSAVTDEARVNIVPISTLEGDAATEGAALDAAIAAQSEALTNLRAEATANTVIAAKLTADGHTVEDIVAIRTDANGNIVVYVDDRA